ncbi:MAG: sigma-70 family RNA polymerase sigma factor [Armatimonadia bacterium]
MVADLVRQAQGGDAEAYTELVRRFQDAVYATAYQQVLDADAARDIAQETFVRAYRALGKLRRAESFPAWIVRICRNLTTDWLRRPERRWVPLDETTRSEYDVAATVAARDLVNRALATLPEDNRLALSLFLVNGYTYQEVAQLTDVPLSTVKGRIERAKGRLAKEVFAMVEDTLKDGAPDEQFTLETVRKSLKQGWDAAQAEDLATSRAVAEEALAKLGSDMECNGARTQLTEEALRLVRRSTFFADPERWREATRELIRLAEERGDEAAATMHVYGLAQQDSTMPADERERAVLRALGLFRASGDLVTLAQALFFRGWNFIHDGDGERGLGVLQEARDEIAGQPYTVWHGCLEASAEHERLSGRLVDKERRVCWGATCTTFKVQDDLLVFGLAQGFAGSSGTPAETAQFHDPFHGLFHQTGIFPYCGPEPGYDVEEPAFSYTPNPTQQRLWFESDSATIRTPAGDFHDCLLMRVSRTESPLDADSDHPKREINKIWLGEKWCWFARGVGPVAYRAERADGIIEHAVLSKFQCPEQREEWVPLVVGTRWEYVPAEPGEGFDVLMVEWLSHRGEDGTWYQPHTAVGNRRAD